MALALSVLALLTPVSRLVYKRLFKHIVVPDFGSGFGKSGILPFNGNGNPAKSGSG